MLVLSECPKCKAKVQPTDLQCLECGADLIEARRQLRDQIREQSLVARLGSVENQTVAPRTAAAAGQVLPGETSKETRLRTFDKQHAQALQKETGSTLLLAILAVAAGVIVLGLGLLRMKTVGWGGVFSLRPADLRSFGGLVDPRLVALALTGSGLGGLLTGVGMFMRYAGCCRAIADVTAGEKPEIVGIDAAVQIGLLLLAVFCAPAGLVVGILLKFSDDSDISGFGTLLLWTSLGLMVLLLANMGVGMIADWAGSRSHLGNAVPSASPTP